MPNLPRQNKTNLQEVLNKSGDTAGEIPVFKAPKHRIVFKHHRKLALILFLVFVVLGLVFMVGKPSPKKEVVLQDPVVESEVLETTYTDQSFKQYADQDYANFKIDYSTMLVIEKVDLENKVVVGYEFDNPDKKHNVKFGDKAQLYWITAPTEAGEGGGEKKQLDFEAIMVGSALNIFTFENPKDNINLTAVSAERIV